MKASASSAHTISAAIILVMDGSDFDNRVSLIVRGYSAFETLKSTLLPMKPTGVKHNDTIDIVELLDELYQSELDVINSVIDEFTDTIMTLYPDEFVVAKMIDEGSTE